MEQDADWNQRIAKRVGQEVARARERLGEEEGRRVSAQALADRCAELGHPLDRSVIAKLEKGIRQTVTVADLLVLAKALDMAPLALIFPVGYELETEVLPGRVEHPVTALRWASGEGLLPAQPDQEEVGQREAARWGSSALYRIRQLLKCEAMIRYNAMRAHNYWLESGRAETPEATKAYEQAAKDVDSTVSGQRSLLERWSAETEAEGYKASLPPIYGEIPETFAPRAGGPFVA
ncbi:hypothetical protein [Streptacidiphilus sp. EB103A]|uniref:hypothetical protein n=1 Tax=Streptacidiphilus sp. EB103A TaxID=3156275 RepID=UPI0035161BEE